MANVIPAFNPNTATETTQEDNPKFTGWATYKNSNGQTVAVWRKNGKIDPQNKGDVFYILKDGNWLNGINNKVYTTVAKAKEEAYAKSLENPITSQYDPRIAANIGVDNTQTVNNTAANSANPTATDADALAALGIANNFGIGEALLSDPTYGKELTAVFNLFKAGKKTAALDALNKTKFAQLDTDARNRYIEKVQQSDVYKEHLNSWLIGIKRNLKQQGSTLTDAELADYYLKGIDDTTILDNALKGGKFEAGKTGGTQAGSYNALLQTATRNGVSMSLLPKVLGFDTMDEVVKDLQTGASIDDYNQKIRNYAKTAMPDWAKKLIDQGQDVTDIVSPYRATISDVLDLPYTSIDVTDKHIQNALASNMSLSELRKQLRKDDRWQYTDAAHSEVANATKQVLQDFGFMG